MGNSIKQDSIEYQIIENLIAENLSLGAELHIKKEWKGSSAIAYAFIITVLSIFYKREFKKPELENIISDGDGDLQFDDPTNDQLKLLEDSFEENIISNNTLLTGNILVTKLIKKIHTDKRPVRLIVARRTAFKKNTKSQGINRLENNVKKVKNFEFIFLNADNLIERMYESSKYLDSKELKVPSSNVLGINGPEGDFALFKLSIFELLRLHQECIDVAANLYNKNIRAYLGRKKGVSQEMERIIETEPDSFHLYHNGITMTTPSPIEKMKGDVYRITKPQIVNGAQTINSLYETYGTKLTQTFLKKAHVLVKVVAADDTKASKICETSNTQQAIKLWDLRSNDDEQIKIENYLNSHKDKRYLYLRKSGERLRKDRINIRLPELYQWSYSALFESPAFAKNNKKSLFELVTDKPIYSEITKKLSYPKNLDEICEVGTYVRGYINNQKKNSFLKDIDFHMISGLYYLKYIRKKQINEEKVLKLIEDILYKYVNDEFWEYDLSVTTNYVFTKSTDAWVHLKKKLNNL